MKTRLHRCFTRSPLALNLCAMSAAFVAYFCMYAFRKPFAAGTYEGLSFFGTDVELKTAFVICQIFGYAISKYLGVKFCPEVTRKNRAFLLVALIVAAELTLMLFAVVPEQLKVAAIFLNGLSLGMVWGLVVWYLEGRQTSEILLAVLSCSFIVSSGIVKDVGRLLIRGFTPLGEASIWSLGPVPEFWMPAATGCVFFLPFLVAVWLLNQIPEPTQLDRQLRSMRKTMSIEDRLQFVQRYFCGLTMLVIAYVLFTAFRDFRDNYTVEVLCELGYEQSVGTISSMETIIAFFVLGVMALVYFVKDNQRAMFAILAIVVVGTLMVGFATLLRQRGFINGYWWMLAVGLGSYLAYVPYNSVLFDRLMASTRATGTAVFAIYIADALGYTGSVVVQLFNDLIVGDQSHLEFLENLSYLVSFLGVLLVVGGGSYFLRMPVAVDIAREEIVPPDAELGRS
ncbi:MAG: DUF5690 family protein [Planctomycetota bacterium]